MDSLYFALCIMAIFWLGLWSIRDPRRPSRMWWPFDMKDDADAPPEAPGSTSKRGRRIPPSRKPREAALSARKRLA